MTANIIDISKTVFQKIIQNNFNFYHSSIFNANIGTDFIERDKYIIVMEDVGFGMLEMRFGTQKNTNVRMYVLLSSDRSQADEIDAELLRQTEYVVTQYHLALQKEKDIQNLQGFQANVIRKFTDHVCDGWIVTFSCRILENNSIC